ncbi:MAG: tetratricopeptide repeat protein [Chloroflexi bacterium]|nr:tetratricopeptide repeat protein [Chloroflexota bacterium]
MSRKLVPSQKEFALYLLGSFQLEMRDGAKKTLIRLPRRKVEILLAHLVLFADREGHTREKLAALFWGDTSAEQARMSLRTSLAVLRKTFGDDVLIADREHIQINPSFPLWVDAREFVKTRASAPESAIELYRGDLLADFYDDWVLNERERFRALYIETLLRLTQHMRSQSEYERALDFARQALVTDPANETAHQHIMFCEMARGNRAAALEQHTECVRLLRDELAVEPSRETQALLNWIKQTPATSSDAARISNLPIPLTSFVGRKHEMMQIKALLASTRLLTLVGAGGSGKTRLSIQVSMELMDAPQFRDGVWWVELATVTDAELVQQAIAKALGVGQVPRRTTLETIVNYLRAKNLLLILDNCEHVIDVTARVVETLLRECADVKILATSREPLDIAGEAIWQVPTLSVPTDLQTREQLLMRYEGVRLFVERASAAQPGFALTEQNVDAVTQICRRLDGIPLAIELAAARVAVLTPEEIAARLDDRFNLLTNGTRAALPRQQTLRALVDWSFDLLSPSERTLFSRLAVFSGGRTLQAAEQVCGFEPLRKSEVLDLLGRLVAKSLLFADESSGEMRYGFLDTIKHYAREKMLLSGEADATRDHHLLYYLDLAEQAAPELEGPRQIEWSNQLEREHANLRNALHHAVEHGRYESALRMCTALTEFWGVRGYLVEGFDWFKQALECSRAAFEPTDSPEFRTSYAWALIKAADLAGRKGDFAAHASYGEAGLNLFRELGDKRGIAGALIVLGTLARMQSNFPLARERVEQAVLLARESGDERHMAAALRLLGIVNEFQGNYALAKTQLEESLQIARKLGDVHAIATTLSNLGNIAQQQGDYAGARRVYDQVLTMEREMAAKWSIAATLSNMGNLAHSEGDYVAAQSYHEQALKIMRQVGDKRGSAVVLTNLGNALLSQGDFETARNLHEETLQLRRELGDKRGVAITFGNLGDVHVGLENYVDAQKLYAEALSRLQELGDKRTIVNCLIGAAQVAVGLGAFERAAKLTGAIYVLRATLDAQIDIRERAFHEHVIHEAQAHLDEATFNAAWTEGENMTPEQAIDLVVQSAI